METPSFSFVMNQAIENALNNVNVSIPAQVVAVDNAKGFVDVQPVLKKRYSDGELVDIPVISKVPIATYRANDAFISLPVKVGDYVNLIFSQRSLDVWLNKGGIVDPVDPRKFNISDAIAYLGVYPETMPLDGVSSEDLVIKNAASKISVKPNGEIVLEGSAIRALADLIVLSGEGDALSLASKVLSELNKIKAAYDSHTHLYSPGPGGPTPTGAPATPMTSPASVASTKVKAE